MTSRKRLSYAQARLWLGIANVGCWVCLAATVLFFDLAGRFFPTEPTTGKKLIVPVLTFLGTYLAVQAPFDLLGGFLLPAWYRRFYGDFGTFAENWVRGVAMQTPVLLAIALSLLFGGEHLFWIVLAWMILLLFGQLGLARLIGKFEMRGSNGWKSYDEVFTGGIGGFPGFQKEIFVTGRGQRMRAIDEQRRRSLRKLLLPNAGIVIALAFNLVGILLATQLVRHSLTTVSGIVELSLWFTLWSFLGLLILPSVSRPAVYAGDYALFARGIAEADFAYYLRHAGSPADEESRSVWVERIFHPVPSLKNRLARWGIAPRWSGGWHAARTTLYLSWAGLSLLNRAVHCNIGKPNGWVLLPCD